VWCRVNPSASHPTEFHLVVAPMKRHHERIRARWLFFSKVFTFLVSILFGNFFSFFRGISAPPPIWTLRGSSGFPRETTPNFWLPFPLILCSRTIPPNHGKAGPGVSKPKTDAFPSILRVCFFASGRLFPFFPFRSLLAAAA